MAQKYDSILSLQCWYENIINWTPNISGQILIKKFSILLSWFDDVLDAAVVWDDTGVSCRSLVWLTLLSSKPLGGNDFPRGNTILPNVLEIQIRKYSMN